MRIKRPPMMHIPFAPLDEVTRTPNLQQPPPPLVENTKGKEKETPININQISAQILPSAKEQITSELSSEIKSTFSSSIENDTPAPPGVTECPHCNIDFRNMAVADVRNHVESCSRPTTADTSSDISELSEPPESPKQLANKLDDNEDQESDLTDLSDLDVLELHDDGIEDFNFDDLPGPYIDNEDDPSSPHDDFIPDIKFPKLRDSKDVLAPLDDIENLSNFELHRRATHVAMVLDTLQREWMALEQETAKAAAGDGPPVIRNPRVPQKEMVYQDRLEADVYGYVHNPHLSLLGKQDPIGQRNSTGDDRIRTRLRKQTKKASQVEDYNDGESSRPVRNRNTPSRFDSESREATPNAVKKPRGRGKGRVGELRSENDARSIKSGSPLASGNISENGLQSLSALRDRTLASTEADEEASGNGSRPSSSSSSRSPVSFDLPDDTELPSKRKKRANTSEVDAIKPPSKKPRIKPNASNAEDVEGSGQKKSRAKQMVLDANGELKSKQSVMMAARWKKYKENPGGPRIGRRRASESEKGTGSDARSSRKRSLGDANDAPDGGRSAKKQKTINSNSGEEDEAKPSDQTQEGPPKGKRGGFRANSGRKPAKGSSASKAKKQQGGSAEQFESHHSQYERATETPAPGKDEPLEPPSSGSTRASKRTRKPSIAKKEADDEISNSPSSSKSKRAKGKLNDGSTTIYSKDLLLPGVPAHLQEGMVLDTDSTDDDEDDEDDDEINILNMRGRDEYEEDDDDDALGPPKKKRGNASSSKSSQTPFDDYPDLPLYNKENPSAEYLALPKSLKMKAVSLARWRTGRMTHMFGEKGPNKTTKEKMASKATSNPSGGANSSRTSVSAAPSSARRRRASKITSQGMDGTEERETEYSNSPSTKAAPEKKKISEYEEFQALASPSLNPDGEPKKRRRRPAALRASTSFVEPGTSSDFEDDAEASGNDNVKAKKGRKEKKAKSGTPLGKGSGKGIGGRPPRALTQIQTDVANAAAKGSSNGNGSGGGSGMTTYEEFQALSQPGTPLLLGKRKRKSALRGGEIIDLEGEDDYEPNDNE